MDTEVALALDRLFRSLPKLTDSAKETPVYYGQITTEQHEKVQDFLKEYIRDGNTYIPRSDVENLLSEVFDIDIPELKDYTIRKTALQPVVSESKVKAFDEDEARELAQNDDYDDWEPDTNEDVQDVEIESVEED